MFALKRAERKAAGRAEQPASTPDDIFLVALALLALAKAALARMLALGADTTVFSAGFEIAGIALVLGVAHSLRRRSGHVVDLIAYSALSVVMLANVIYASVFTRIADPSMLALLGQAGEVHDSVLAALRPMHALFVVDIPVLAAWAQWRSRNRAVSGRVRSMPVTAVVAVALIVTAVQIALVLELPDTVDSFAAARARGFGVYQISRLVPHAEKVSALSGARGAGAAGHDGEASFAQQIETAKGSQAASRTVAFAPGAYRGKNVILVQVEALNAYVIGADYRGQEITPNLNKLIVESCYFPNAFSQTSAGNTSDAEFTANTSMLVEQGKPASTTFSADVIPALPRLMEKAGYSTLTLHTNDVTFWNRKEMYAALGFQRYYDRAFFKDRDKYWRASDKVLFEDGTKVLASLEASGQPFYAQFVTMTSHNPFRYPHAVDRPVKVDKRDASSMLGKYIGSISYADEAIGEFIDRLKAAGLYDDSIVIFYGDHYALPPDTQTAADKTLFREILGRDYADNDTQRVGLIVHLPGQTQGQRVDTATGQVDIMPTIADLAGIDLARTPHVGRSVFAGEAGFVPLRDGFPSGSFADDRVIFEPGLSFDDGKAVSLRDGSPTTASAAEKTGFERAQRLGALALARLESLPHRAGAAARQVRGF